jgi:hypothetical protein
MVAENGSSLPDNMTAQSLTKLKSKGWLKWASLDLFNLLTIVEKTIIKFVNEGIIFLRDAFEAILRELVFDNLPQVGCQFMTEIIFKFMILRFKCIAIKEKAWRKRKRKKSNAHTHAKLSKT